MSSIYELKTPLNPAFEPVLNIIILFGFKLLFLSAVRCTEIKNVIRHFYTLYALCH